MYCNADMDEILDKFKIWPDSIINFRITFPLLLKMPLLDFVITVTCSDLIGTSSVFLLEKMVLGQMTKEDIEVLAILSKTFRLWTVTE